MIKRMTNTKKEESKVKAARGAEKKQCKCCNTSPCGCPESHGHKK